MSLLFHNEFEMIQRTKWKMILIVLICPVIFSCAQENKSDKSTLISVNIGIDYDLRHPDKSIQLPYDLEEISGLSFFRDSILVAVQDELGKLYFYDYNKEELLDDFSFGKEGDFEGVQLVDETIYAIKSNGDIYNIDFKSKVVKLIKTPLKTRNDVEGLTYDVENERLIIACKGFPSLGKQGKKGRSFYEFDLKNQALINKPLFNITKTHINSFLGVEYDIDVKEFKPSAIAIHPITGQLYILAHGGKLLLKLNKFFEIIGVSSLKNSFFKQPEGICFTPSGDLLIANEGRGKRGTLLYFKNIQSK